MVEHIQLDAGGARVVALVYAPEQPPRATLVLAPGVTGGQRQPLVTRYAAGLAARGIQVVTFDFPALERRGRGVDADASLEPAFHDVVAAVRRHHPSDVLFVGGKSIGGRVACRVAGAPSEDVGPLAGVVVLGFPLHAIGKRDARNASCLERLRVPAIIVQGTRDPFGAPQELRPLLRSLPAASEIQAVEGGDHSFTVVGRNARAQDEVHAAVLDALARWLRSVGSADEGAAMPKRAFGSRLRARLGSLRRSASRRLSSS